MPVVAKDDPIGAAGWRGRAAFHVLHACLDERWNAVEALLKLLAGQPSPTAGEWCQTLSAVAAAEATADLQIGWDRLLRSIVAVLPNDLRQPLTAGQSEPLASARFLPSQDGRLLARNDATRLFFQPVREVDDASDLVDELPDVLKSRVAFVHDDVVSQEGARRANTPVNRFLDGRFANGFDRRLLLREIVLPAIPQLPVPHATPEADICRALLGWALRLLGTDEEPKLGDAFARLPVPCLGGWYPLCEASFGPGWTGHVGIELSLVCDALPAEVADPIRAKMLLPPDDAHWPIFLGDRAPLLEKGGVFTGLRLVEAPTDGWDRRFQSEGHGRHQLPETPPPGIPEEHWNAWKVAVHGEAKPYYDGWFWYELQGVQLLQPLHLVGGMDNEVGQALTTVLLASLPRWPAGWDTVRVRKTDGNSDAKELVSPLAWWLGHLPWLRDGTPPLKLRARWWVPGGLLVGAADRFAHLDPLSKSLSRWLERDKPLAGLLCVLGLNRYPIEEETTGPQLLDALAGAWHSKRVPPHRLDVFLGQLRDAWRHLSPKKGLPSRFLIRTGARRFETWTASQLPGAYLPDHDQRTHALREFGKPILEMRARDAEGHAGALGAVGIRRASALVERLLADGQAIPSEAPGLVLADADLAWIALPLLAIAAHGGSYPQGAGTDAWGKAAARLRRARVLGCESLSLQLLDGSQVVAEAAVEASWTADEVLVVLRRQAGASYERLTNACQAALGRLDLAKDLRLVFGSLPSDRMPTPEDIEAALLRADIDAEDLADVRYRWSESSAAIVDRIRPVLLVAGETAAGLDAVAGDDERLAPWLLERVPAWPDLLREARRARDDAAMGVAAWRALGEIAQLPRWNAALTQLGGRFTAAVNRRASEQAQAHLNRALPLLRAIARHEAVSTGSPPRYSALLAAAVMAPDPGWAALWWEVPFSVIVDRVASAWAGIGSGADGVECLRAVKSAEELRVALQNIGITADPDPNDTARTNARMTAEVDSALRELHRVWVITQGSGRAAARQEKLDDVGFLRVVTIEEHLASVLSGIGDEAFTTACMGCTTVDECQKLLGLTLAQVEAARAAVETERLKKQKQQRTFDVAGVPFELQRDSFAALLERLRLLPVPTGGPDVRADETSPLSKVPPSRPQDRGGDSGNGGAHGGSRASPEVRELVGKVGEMHAWRFLRAKFGEEVVTPGAWVSLARLEAIPLLPGETHGCSDGIGCDFRFQSDDRTWHVEVKSTSDAAEQFEMGISEIELGSRLAADEQRQPWRILRVNHTLSASPSFEWLPNPFAEGFRDLFRIKQAGLRVWYRRG